MDWSIAHDDVTGEEYVAVSRPGDWLLRDPLTNKGTAFTIDERRRLHLEGRIPPVVSSVEQQLDRTYEAYRQKTTPLEQYIYLTSLQDRNETLFFRLLHDHIDEMMPVVYTPVVGEACQQFSHIYRRPRGLYISYDQQDRIEEILRHQSHTSAIIVVTDGERILGLGDQGIGGMGIPTGKLSLYTACAGIPPWLTLPITLDVGTDNDVRLNDPLYVGLRHRRIRGDAYQAFVDRFVDAVMRVLPDTVLQWEDFLKGNAITQLERFRNRLCTFNDDIQGTAAVAVAGVFGALRISGGSMRDQRILLGGAGASAQGIASLLVSALCAEGLSLEEARLRLATVDSQGLVTTGRRNMEAFKAAYARDVNEVAGFDCTDPAHVTLEEAIRNLKPTVLIGTSGTAGLFTEAVVRAMTDVNARPIIFPLSNPTSKAECTPADATRWSEGRAILATGSPFAPVEYGGRRMRVGQGNNAFIFPGVGLGLWVGGVRRVTDAMFLDAARALANLVGPDDLAEGAVYPKLTRIRDCSHAVACAVIRRAVAEGHAEPGMLDDLEGRVRRAMWEPIYKPIRVVPASER
ncbi:MAG: NAD-dependent malic enzyme [Vicinamibacterales bacterium]